MRGASDPAELFGGELKARALGYLFLAGGVVGCLTLVLPHPEAVEDGPLYGLTALAAAVGVAILARAEALPELGLHGLVASGTLILGASNYFLGTTALYPILYSWVGVYAFTCFARRPALAHMALIAATYPVVLAVQDAPSAVTRWLLAIGTPLVAGAVVSWLLERVRHEAEAARERARVLGESEARTRAIIEAAPNAFATIDADGAVLAWNHEAERLFGVPAEEAVGRPVAELVFAPEDRPAHVEMCRQDLEGPAPAVPSRREVEMIRRDGSRFPAEMIVSRVSAEGRALLVFFVNDLSDRAQQEREREELYREQAARREAEQMAGMVRGLQVLLDAALAHRRLEGLLAALLPRVCEVLSAESATIALADEDGELVVRASTAPSAGDEPMRIALGDGIAGGVAERGEPLLLQDPPADLAVDPAMFGMSSVISVPLKARGTVTGVIQVGATAPRRFADDDLLLLGLAADRVAIAIDHVHVYEREHRIAETLQRTLLPDRLPRLAGLEVAARYLAAASEAEVGGDWYDVVPIDSCRVGLVMGDVAGKGLAAASMVGRLRSAMRAYALEGHDPSTVVERLNQLVFSELEDSQMTTLVYVVIDQAEGTLSWVNAGHLPPLIAEEEGPRFLEGPGSVPLGVMPFARYEAGSVPLAAGTTVLLYTDGLVERPGELLDEGLARLAAAVAQPTDGPERLLNHVLTELVPAGAASDDVALLALHSPPVAERLALTLSPVPAELASMRALLRRWLFQARGSDEDVAEILTATGEAAANAIEHGAGDEPFEVVGVVEDGEVQITVSDRGAWREKSPDREGGRGIVLMRALMDEVEVAPGADGTTVRMRRRLGNGR